MVVRPYVQLAKSQYEQLKSVNEKTGTAVSGMIREAVSRFARNEEYPLGTSSSYLPRGSRNNSRTVTAYLPRWEGKTLASLLLAGWEIFPRE